MPPRSVLMVGLASLLLCALLLTFLGPDRLLGIDSVLVGTGGLLVGGWLALGLRGRSPDDDDDPSPGEWQAWLGLAFVVALTAYFLVHAPALGSLDELVEPVAQAVGRNIGTLIVLWVVGSTLMDARFKGQVQEDERDRQIARVAREWGNGAVTVCVIGIALMLGLSPPDELIWAQPLAIANLLVFALLWGGLVGQTTSVVQYWRDRQ
jgi:hypothetical protein